MTFEKRLAARAEEIDGELVSALARATTADGAVPERLAAAMRHAVMAGGKRLRPFIVLETAAAFGATATAAMPAAVAVELVHCYSLVHDDLPAMDNDRMRRGKPTVWAQWDDWTAILAGDALLTLAFEHLARGSDPGTAPLNLQLVGMLAVAAGGQGMVGGQCLDLEADKLGQPALPSVGHVELLQAMKTGALFRFACFAGAAIGRANPDEQAALARFGEKLGAAFQLADDLLDVEGDAATVGKATAKDAAAGKATLVGLEGLDAAHARLASIEKAALAEIASLGSRADVLRETLRFACARRR
jgi:farnesyl diphosphate synthase